MEILLYVLAAFVVLVGLALFSHRKHRSVVEESLYHIGSTAEIEKHCAEFRSFIANKYNRMISETPTDDDWKFIDEHVKNGHFIQVFQTPALKWRFVLTCGSFLGEYLRKNHGYSWNKTDLGKFEMTLANGQLSITAFPFDKVQKHYELGSRGDLYAYIQMLKSAGR